MSRRKKDEKEPDLGLGTALGASVAVVGAAALAFGAWKLYDLFANSSEAGASAAPVPTSSSSSKPPKKVCDSSDDDGDNIPVPSRRNDNSIVRAASTTARPSCTPAKPEMSLSAQLLDYSQKYVDMNPMEFREAAKVVKDLKMQIAHCMQRDGKLKALGASGTVVDTGSSTDGLMVICPETYDVLIPFVLSPDECTITRADVTSEFHSIRFEQDGDAWADACDSRKCLDAKKLVYLLSDVLNKAVCSGTSVVTNAKKLKIEGTAAVVEVHYTSGLKKVTVNILPAVVVGDRRFVPEHVPDTTRQEQEGFCWRESFARKEQQSLNRFGSGITSHKIILKIFKAVRLNFPLQFGLLSSYHYKTVLLRVLDDQMEAADWEISTISERFIDFLIELGNCLKERNLPHYFRPECNLLGQTSQESSQNLGHFINRIVGHHDIASLLKYDYGCQ